MLTVAGAPLIMTRMKSQSSAGEVPGDIHVVGLSTCMPPSAAAAGRGT